MKVKVITEDDKTLLFDSENGLLLYTDAFKSDGVSHSYFILDAYASIEVGKEINFEIAEYKPDDGDPFFAKTAKVKSISVTEIGI